MGGYFVLAGIAAMAASALSAAVFAIVFHKKKVKLDQELFQEYGKKIH